MVARLNECKVAENKPHPSPLLGKEREF